MSERAPATWIFQANPANYMIHEGLSESVSELWNVRQHTKEIAAGDRVLLWISGKEAGIYAIGTVMTPPRIMQDSTTGKSRWIDEREKARARARVEVRYDDVFLDNPLYRSLLLQDPYLKTLKILRSPQGTNFKVTDSEWEAISLWLDDR